VEAISRTGGKDPYLLAVALVQVLHEKDRVAHAVYAKWHSGFVMDKVVLQELQSALPVLIPTAPHSSVIDSI
jgi:hypothetical protein